MPLNQQAKKGITMLAGVIDPDYQGEINYSPVEVRKDICIIQKIPQSVSEYYHTLWLKSVENWNNLMEAQLPMAQALQE